MFHQSLKHSQNCKRSFNIIKTFSKISKKFQNLQNILKKFENHENIHKNVKNFPQIIKTFSKIAKKKSKSSKH